MDVLLSNDDGITAPGLRALYDALVKAGHNVFAAAPMRQQSGVSHALTVFEPLRSQKIEIGDFRGVGIFGTPADCVKLALGRLHPKKPDLVMAGINMGRNVGPDIFYSGTVAAAAEGAHAGLPSMSISYANPFDVVHLPEIARHVVKLAEKLTWDILPVHRVININYPDKFAEGEKLVKICPQSAAVWQNRYAERADPRGNPYWWLDGDIDSSTLESNSDISLLNAGYITVTPLRFEHTDDMALNILADMGL